MGINPPPPTARRCGDRIAKAMVERAEQEGLLKAGDPGPASGQRALPFEIREPPSPGCVKDECVASSPRVRRLPLVPLSPFESGR